MPKNMEHEVFVKFIPIRATVKIIKFLVMTDGISDYFTYLNLHDVFL